MSVTPKHLDIDGLLTDPATSIVVCCGSGGVGKTTAAAALALRAAEQGRNVVVLTIDPARRLAQSLGLTELDNNPREVEGVEGPGQLFAMMLDMQRTFDEIVEKHADPERVEQILSQPLLPVALGRASPARRSTWRWRSWASSAAPARRPAAGT